MERELRIARIRWMQQWALNPSLHGQVFAAARGRMRLEVALGHMAPLGPNGKPTEAATGLLRLFDGDLRELRERDERFREKWYGDWRELFSDNDTRAREFVLKTVTAPSR